MNLLISLSLSLLLIVNHVNFVVTFDVSSVLSGLTESLLKDDQFKAISKREAEPSSLSSKNNPPPITPNLSKYRIHTYNRRQR